MRLSKPVGLLALTLLACLASSSAVRAVTIPPEVYSERFYQSPVHAGPDDLLMIAGYGFDTTLDPEGKFRVHVSYQRVDDTTNLPSGLHSVPILSSPFNGVVETVAVTEHAVTVRIPQACGMTRGACWNEGQSYVLRVANGRYPIPVPWSDPLLINDARPAWISPSRVYVNDPHPFCDGVTDCDRYLKVVGRNLQPEPGEETRVRLYPYFEGPPFPISPWYVVTAEVTNEATDEYVAKIELPPSVYCEHSPCQFTISVSRDGVSWEELEGQRLEVLHDPPAPPVALQVSMTTCQSLGCSDCGVCEAGDLADDTNCIVCLIDAASDQGGGVVAFGEGDWILRKANDFDPDNSILVGAGVSLRGEGVDDTSISYYRYDAGELVTDPEFLNHANDTAGPPVFTLLGNNEVSGIHFKDDYAVLVNDNPVLGHGGGSWAESQFLQIGPRPGPLGDLHETVEDIVIMDNKFEGVRVGVGDGNASELRRIYITDNEFEGHRWGVKMTGRNAEAGDLTFKFEDSIVARNQLYPGSYYDDVEKAGVIGTGFNAGNRIDFSDNIADGRPNPTCETLPGGCGWRASHFWNLGGAQERLLVSGNQAWCTGDKGGDGEFLGFDNPGSTPIFGGTGPNLMVGVDGSGSNYVIVPSDTPWMMTEDDMTNHPSFFENENGFWLAIVKGKGLGQVRRIVGYQEVAGGWQITVDPPWDVTPKELEPGEEPDEETSWVAGQRRYWQLYAVGNTVDNRGVETGGECEKDNPAKTAGRIWLGASADSSIAGNSQTESDGISLIGIVRYRVFDPGTPLPWSHWSGPRCNPYLPEYPNPQCASTQFFTELRNNVIDGEFDFQPLECGSQPDAEQESTSGIQVAASGEYYLPTGEHPVNMFGVTISGNEITTADGRRGGAISLWRGWSFVGPPEEKLHDNFLIHHNSIQDLKRPDVPGGCECCSIAPVYWLKGVGGGTGIRVGHPSNHNTILYGNTIENVCHYVIDYGTNTLDVDRVLAGSSLETCAQLLQDAGSADGEEDQCFDPGFCGVDDTQVSSCSDPGDLDSLDWIYPSFGPDLDFETVFNCPPGETVHIESCGCFGACGRASHVLACDASTK